MGQGFRHYCKYEFKKADHQDQTVRENMKPNQTRANEEPIYESIRFDIL